MDDHEKLTPVEQFDFEAAVRTCEERVRAAISAGLSHYVSEEGARATAAERYMPDIRRFAGAYPDAVARRRLTEKRAKRSGT